MPAYMVLLALLACITSRTVYIKHDIHYLFMFQVKNPKGQEQSFKCADTQYILDAAEAAGLEIPNRHVPETRQQAVKTSMIMSCQ
jgi:hypothetical protein